MPKRRSALLLLVLAGCQQPLLEEPERPPEPPEPPEPAARWIWASDPAGEDERAWFEHSFELAARPASARVWAACDDRMELFLNGMSVLQSDRWRQPVHAEAAEHLAAGTNVLAVWTRNESGPGGLIVDLELTWEDGRVEHVLSDSTWHATTRPPDGTWPASEPSGTAWDTAVDLAGLGEEPWEELEPSLLFEPQLATAASELTVPEGFAAELLYSVPRARQGSWVSLAKDDRGRLIASDQYGGLYRITPPAVGGPNDVLFVEELDLELGEAQGLLYAFDSLYAVVNGGALEGSGLYRARDTDGDDQFDEIECLRKLDGSGEHGPHAVLLGPDGASLYVFAGNHTRLPERLASSRVPWLWQEDQLLPRIPDPGGHAVDIPAPGGWVCRTDPDGREWELVAVGFRNSYDGGFDEEGELFAYDSDMEWDVGLPWYRFPRVVHVVPGAEFGWRNGSGKFPADYPDTLPPVVETDLSSPTGCTFATEAAFPEPWRSSFLIADWAYGRIDAVHLEPAGASFAGRVEPFVSGPGLPLTDLVVGDDGALYFTTGGRRTQSGLYRLRWVGPAETPGTNERRRVPPVDLLAADRKRLEASFGLPDEAALPFAWVTLDSPYRFLRFAARTVLELRDPESWTDRALAETRPRASLEALLALVRAEAIRAETLFPRLLALPWEDLEPERFVDALRIAELALVRVPGAEAHRTDLVLRLDPLFPTGSERLDRELCRVLAYLQAPELVARTLPLLEAAPSQEAAIEYAYALRVVADGWSEDERERYVAFLDHAVETLEGGNSFQGYLEQIRDEAIQGWGWEVAAAAPAESGAPAPAKVVVADWTLAELVPALERVDESRSYDAGLRAYDRAGCTECHRLGGLGRNQGPDITGAGNRYNARDLLENILEPSRVISDFYQDTEVWTLDGRLVVGRYEGTVDGVLRIRTPPPESELHRIPEEAVELRRPHPLSRMPEDLLDTLTEDEVVDLLAFVLGMSKPDEER